MKNSNQLFDYLTEMRNRIAHFLLKPQREVLPLWDGRQFRQYSLASALLLHYADAELKALSLFYETHLLEKHRSAQRPSRSQ